LIDIECIHLFCILDHGSFIVSRSQTLYPTATQVTHNASTCAFSKKSVKGMNTIKVTFPDIF